MVEGKTWYDFEHLGYTALNCPQCGCVGDYKVEITGFSKYVQSSWNIPGPEYFDQNYRTVGRIHDRPILETFSYMGGNTENSAQIYWGSISLPGSGSSPSGAAPGAAPQASNSAWLVTSRDRTTVYFYSPEPADSPVGVKTWYALPNSLNTQVGNAIRADDIAFNFIPDIVCGENEELKDEFCNSR